MRTFKKGERKTYISQDTLGDILKVCWEKLGIGDDLQRAWLNLCRLIAKVTTYTIMYAGGIKKSLNVCDVVIYKTKFHAWLHFLLWLCLLKFIFWKFQLYVWNINFSFSVTSKMVEPFLEGFRLEEAIVLNKVYIVNYKDVLKISCKDEREVRMLLIFQLI